MSTEFDYERSGTARFFGVGNDSPYGAQRVFTRQDLLMRARLC